MKRIHSLKLLAVLAIAPLSAFAAGGLTTDSAAGPVGPYLQSIIAFINSYLLPLVLAIAFIALVWGIVQYFVIGGSNDDAKAKGKSLIIYAVIGFVVILSFYGITKILVSGIGLGGETLKNVPVTPVTR